MERFCDKCGSLVSGDVKFCPTCGAPMQGAVDLAKAEDIMPPPIVTQNVQPVQQSYGYTQNTSMGYGAPQYGQTYNTNVPTEQMTTGQWIGTILLCSCFGLISFILTAVWAFSGSTPEPKRGFCKGYFFFQLIMAAVSIVLSLIFFGIFMANIDKFLDMIEDIMDYGYYYDW